MSQPKINPELEIQIHPRDPSESQQILSPLEVSQATSRFCQKKHDRDLDDYFVGPRDTDKHSKWPVFMRMHGSILPEMILPILFVAGWATAITCISKFVTPLAVSNILLTVLGFVVGLALSFRSSTAYERYSDGRKYWSQLLYNSNILARMIWLHAEMRDGEAGKKDLLKKISGLNLILAFAVSLKHKLRFEPYTGYDDLCGLIEHLRTFAREAEGEATSYRPKESTLKSIGSYLGVSFAESNPRKVLKKSSKPLGNLPLEVHMHLAAYIDQLMTDDLLKMRFQSTTLAALNGLNEVLSGTERILNTPLPVAYSIAISQITWVYVLLLPFQLIDALGWVTIPGTAFAAYVILGIALIGTEIENPFGNDVNDLPLDTYCAQVATELDIIAASPPPNPEEFFARAENLVLFPLSKSGFPVWAYRTEERIREALWMRAHLGERRRNEGSDQDSHTTGREKTPIEV